MTGYCTICARKGRLTYPQEDPVVCTMRCAAEEMVRQGEAGGWPNGFCKYCGKDENCRCYIEINQEKS